MTKTPPLAWITLNRPHRLNTITPRLIDELETVAKRCRSSDGSIRVVVLRGEGGRAFSAGADLTAFGFSSPDKGVRGRTEAVRGLQRLREDAEARDRSDKRLRLRRRLRTRPGVRLSARLRVESDRSDRDEPRDNPRRGRNAAARQACRASEGKGDDLLRHRGFTASEALKAGPRGPGLCKRPVSKRRGGVCEEPGEAGARSPSGSQSWR